MKTENLLSGSRASLISALLLFAVFMPADAAIHIIQFGGTLGLHYSPNSLNVTVGDTIQWEGNFSTHPLSSTSVPAGAASFINTTGTVFTYQVSTAGTYLYQCDVHVGAGMTGSFTASTPTGVEDKKGSSLPGVFRLNQNYPNPFNPSTSISFDIPFRSPVTVKIYNLIGSEIATLVNENMEPGRYSRRWNAGSFPSGTYFYRLNAGAFTETRKLILIK